MTLPTPAQQRHNDIDLMYGAGMPSVASASYSGSSFYVRLIYGPNAMWADVDDAFAHAEAVCLVRQSDLASPARAMEITIDGQAWKVIESAEFNDYEWRLALERNVRVVFNA